MESEKDKIKIIIQKNSKKDIVNAIFVKTLIFINLLIIGGCFSFIIICSNNSDIIYKHNVDVLIDDMIKKSVDDNIVKTIAENCNSSESDDVGKIYCVNSFIRDNFNYNHTEEFVHPDELINTAGDCLDWSVFYRAVFELIDIKTEQILIGNHTYIVAYGDDYYCNIDQLLVNCEGLLE